MEHNTGGHFQENLFHSARNFTFQQSRSQNQSNAGMVKNKDGECSTIAGMNPIENWVRENLSHTVSKADWIFIQQP